MTVFAETNRFILRSLEAQDLEGMWALDSDPEVHLYLGNKPVTSKDKIKEVIDYVQMQYDTYGIGRWAVIHKPTGEFMGWSGLKMNFERTINAHHNFYDIGYRLRPKFWCQGFATETAKIALDYAFYTLQADTVYGIAMLDNKASRSVLSKIGLTYKGDFILEPENEMLAWYEAHKPQT